MPVKWQGKSLYQLNQRAARVKNLETAVGELCRLLEEARRAHLAELAKILDRDQDGLILGPWPCEASPVQTCVYDPKLQEQDDECLFCQLPLERK